MLKYNIEKTIEELKQYITENQAELSKPTFKQKAQSGARLIGYLDGKNSNQPDLHCAGPSVDLKTRHEMLKDQDFGKPYTEGLISGLADKQTLKEEKNRYLLSCL